MLLDTNSSVNFAKCIYASSHQESPGMAIDSTGVRPFAIQHEAISNMRRTMNVELLRAFLGMTSCLHQDVGTYNNAAAPLTPS